MTSHTGLWHLNQLRRKGSAMGSTTTNELGLTRLWYLIGKWEGAAKGPDLRLRASARCVWALDDHFLVMELEFTDASSGRIASAEHSYIYYDRDLNCLVGDIFGSDGSVEHALGHADSRGRMALTTERLSRVPKGLPICHLRRTTWMMATSQWAFTVERDLGEGFAPYLEGQMRRRG
jgi:hypothetical protein